MSTYKKHKVVLLATKERAPIALGKNDLMVYDNYLHSTIQNKNDDFINQHLYILSDEEIKEGDWAYAYEKKEICKHVSLKHFGIGDGAFLKIIATTDISLIKIQTVVDNKSLTISGNLELPQIPQLFIEEYVKSYNSGKPIEWVEVEYIIRDFDNKELVLKIDAVDNLVFIKTAKDNYTRKEVEMKCREAFKAGRMWGETFTSWFIPTEIQHKEKEDKWIEQNL
jgi:hypothetical protein